MLWREPFLKALRTVPVIRVAALAAAVDQDTVANHRKKDPEFDRQVEDAIQQAVDMLEAQAWQQSIREPSLARFMLQHWKPGRYQDSLRQEHTGAGGGPITFRVIYEDRKTIEVVGRALPAQIESNGRVVEVADRPEAMPVMGTLPAPTAESLEAAREIVEEMRWCPVCKGPMPPRMANGPPRQTCSTACRMKKMRERKRANGINGKGPDGQVP